LPSATVSKIDLTVVYAMFAVGLEFDRIRTHTKPGPERRVRNFRVPTAPLSLNSRGRCWTRTRSKPELRRTIVNVSETSVAVMVVHKLPSQDVAREVIEHGRQIEPAPIIRG
jgi:hypothetical protein